MKQQNTISVLTLRSSTSPATFFPSASQKTELFRQRYHIIHQRLLRSESFQDPSITLRSNNSSARQVWKITSIANLLGRSGSGHLLLGMLVIAPTGTLALNDLSGSISLDISQATPIDETETWLCPGMIVLVDGVYEEEFAAAGGGFSNTHGVGGTIKGRFVGFSIGAPGCETRAATLGISDAASPILHSLSTGFGWVDFLGLGSERAVGPRMRRLERRLLSPHTHSSASSPSTTIAMLGEVNLDDSRAMSSLRSILDHYAAQTTPPLAFILFGNFARHAAMAAPRAHTASTAGSTSTPDSMSYKEHFDALAALLADFPTLLRSAAWLFVPGDNDPWPSAFSAGAATPLPRGPVPAVFAGRVRRAFAAAGAPPTEPCFSTNPTRMTLFGPSQELVCFRDDASARLRRAAIPLQRPAPLDTAAGSGAGSASDSAAMDLDDSSAMDLDNPVLPPPAALAPAEISARRLAKTLLDQSHLSPYPPSTRPVHWAYAGALALHPLPTALVLCDAGAAASAVTYQGCVVLNPGRIVAGAWCEWDVRERRGQVRWL